MSDEHIKIEQAMRSTVPPRREPFKNIGDGDVSANEINKSGRRLEKHRRRADAQAG
jgi:hypothetical protein